MLIRFDTYSRLVSLTFMLVLVACDVRPFSSIGGGNGNGNRRPNPMARTIITTEDRPGTSQIDPNDPDTDQRHSYTVTMTPAHGTAIVDNGLVTYTPRTNFSGNDRLRVTVTDNGDPPLSGAVTIAVTVSGRNDPPVPTAAPIVTSLNMEGVSQIHPNDPDAGQEHTFEIAMLPTHGTADLDEVTGQLRYQPNLDFAGRDQLRISVRDNGTPSLEAMTHVNIRVYIPVLSTDLEHRTFSLASGGAFHPALAGIPVRLVFGSFAGPVGNFTFIRNTLEQAEGFVTLGDACTFDVTLSSFRVDLGPQAGAITIDPCEVDLNRHPLMIMAAQPAELANRAFICPDGAAFGIAASDSRLDFSGFVQDIGNFTLSAGDTAAHGRVTVTNTCEFDVIVSDFSLDQGPRATAQFTFDVCEIDTVSGRLHAENFDMGMSLSCRLRAE